MADLYRLQAVPLAVFNTASLTGTFQAMNGTGFAAPVKILKIYNGGTNGVTISLDGVNSHDYFPPGATFVLDCQTNHADNSSYGAGTLNVAQLQIIYGMGTAGTGNFYITGYY